MLYLEKKTFIVIGTAIVLLGATILVFVIFAFFVREPERTVGVDITPLVSAVFDSHNSLVTYSSELVTDAEGTFLIENSIFEMAGRLYGYRLVSRQNIDGQSPTFTWHRLFLTVVSANGDTTDSFIFVDNGADGILDVASFNGEAVTDPEAFVWLHGMYINALALSRIHLTYYK